jgi:hypothetical protein
MASEQHYVSPRVPIPGKKFYEKNDEQENRQPRPTEKWRRLVNPPHRQLNPMHEQANPLHQPVNPRATQPSNATSSLITLNQRENVSAEFSVHLQCCQIHLDIISQN